MVVRGAGGCSGRGRGSVVVYVSGWRGCWPVSGVCGGGGVGERVVDVGGRAGWVGRWSCRWWGNAERNRSLHGLSCGGGVRFGGGRSWRGRIRVPCRCGSCWVGRLMGSGWRREWSVVEVAEDKLWGGGK